MGLGPFGVSTGNQSSVREGGNAHYEGRAPHSRGVLCAVSMYVYVCACVYVVGLFSADLSLALSLFLGRGRAGIAPVAFRPAAISNNNGSYTLTGYHGRCCCCWG